MIELPEGSVLAGQLNETIAGKSIAKVAANNDPHKFAWFHGNPADYDELLKGKKIGASKSFGGKVEIEAEDMRICFAEGINLRLLSSKDKLPKKHQLLITFNDGTMLAASVQMYGGLWAFKEGEFEDHYYLLARKAISPLSKKFDKSYFDALIEKEQTKNMSIKAFLATEQRIPGLGNGVLQDILYFAKVHPRRKVNSLSNFDKQAVFSSIKSTLLEMTKKGGRDTEKDLFGKQGGYETRVSKFTLGKKCPVCDGEIAKASYMGGSVYFCTKCQAI